MRASLQQAEPGTPDIIKVEAQQVRQGLEPEHTAQEERGRTDMDVDVNGGERATTIHLHVKEEEELWEETGEKNQEHQNQQEQQPDGPSGASECEEPAASTHTSKTSLTNAAAASQQDSGRQETTGGHSQQLVSRKRKAVHPRRVALHPMRVGAPVPSADDLLLADAQMDSVDAGVSVQLHEQGPEAAGPKDPNSPQRPKSPRIRSPSTKSKLSITQQAVHKLLGPNPKLPMEVLFRVSLHGTLQEAQATGKIRQFAVDRLGILVPCSMGSLVYSLTSQKRLRRTKVLDFTWSLSSPEGRGLPVLLLDLQPVTDDQPSAETGQEEEKEELDGESRPQAAAAGEVVADRQRGALPGKVQIKIKNRGGLTMGTSAPPSDPLGQISKASLPPATQKVPNLAAKKRARLDTPAEQQASWVHVAPHEEQVYKQEILHSLQGMRPGVSMEDVERYYSHTILKSRANGIQTDKYFHVQAPNVLPTKLRSFVEVARFIRDHMGQPQQGTLSQQLQYPGPDHQPPLQPQQIQQTRQQPGAEQGAGGPGDQSPAQLLQVLAGALDLLKADTALQLSSDAQRLQAAALAVVFGEGILKDPDVRSLLLNVPPHSTAAAAAPAGGAGAWDQSLEGMLPLLAGNICMLPDELLQQVAAELGLAVQDERLCAKLLVWSAGAAVDMIAARTKGGPSATSAAESSSAPPTQLTRQLTMKEVMELEPLAAKLHALVPSGGPELKPMKVLLPAYRQVWKQGPAVLALAVCLMRAHGGRVGEESDKLGKLKGQAMRFLSQAASSGKTSLDALSAAVNMTLQHLGPGGGRLNVTEDTALADDVIYAAYDAADELFQQQQQQQQRQQQQQQQAVDPAAGTAEELRSSLREVCLAAGKALHALRAEDLAHNIAGVVRLVHGSPGQRGLPLPTAVAAVAAGYHPSADAGMGFLDLLKEVEGLLGA